MKTSHLRRSGRPVPILVACFGVLLLGGCQEEVLDDLKPREKGVYTGKIDQQLTPDQVETLRQRGRMQEGI